MPIVSGVKNIIVNVRSGRTAKEVRGRIGVGGRSIYIKRQSDVVTRGPNEKYIRLLV